MDLTALQKFVDEEAAALGQGYPHPLETEASSEGDDKLGEVPGDLLPLFGRIQELSGLIKDKLAAERAKCLAHTCTDEGHIQVIAECKEIKERKGCLSEIFWLMVRKRLNIPFGTPIGLRSDWQVVTMPDEELEPESEPDFTFIGIPGSPTNLADLLSIFRRIG